MGLRKSPPPAGDTAAPRVSRHHHPFDLVADTNGSYTVTCRARPLFRWAPQATSVELLAAPESGFAPFDIVRWAAPIVCAPLGLRFLHAAAVATGGGVTALMGPGGAGKSTLARMMVEQGSEAIADDAVICNSHGMVAADAESCFRAWCRDAVQTLPADRTVDFRSLVSMLTADNRSRDARVVQRIVFLQLPRSSTGGSIAAPLTTAEAFHRLVQQSFGSLADPRTWAGEAAVYGTLLQVAQCSTLNVVDGLDALRESLARQAPGALPGID